MYSGKQALRLEKFKASDIGGLDKELKERKGSGKYDSTRTPYNIELINYDGPTLASSTYDYLYSNNINYNPNKKGTKVLNGLIITSGQEFFEHYGMEFKDTGEVYKTGDNVGQPIRHVVIDENHQLPTEIKRFFDESLNFIKEYVGSENIRYAAIHLDESTPHMHIYFTPVVNEVKRKVFELDENGHQLKHEITNKKGEKKLVPIQKKDENGNNIYETVKGKFLNSDQFLKQKGGNASYTLLQDDYNEFIKSKGYNLFRGEIGGDMDMSFGTLTDQYIESQKNKVRRRTMETYLKRRRYFTDFENVKLKDMDGNLYHKFQQDLWNKPIKCSTRNDVQKFLKIILNWGMKMYDINLMKFYKKIEFFKDPNEMKVEKDVYTFEEFQKYITGTTNLNDKAMFEMLYYCGLRRGECRGLQWADIDWNNKLVSIPKQANSVKDSQKYYELTPPKTSKSIRTLPLTEALYNDLVNLYNEKKKYYGFNDKWFIFGEHDPLTFGMMSRINGRIAKNADIRRIPLHSFRHSCASLLINTGQPVTTVSKYLGHASTKETLDTYAHMFPNNLTNVKNTIDNLNLGI